MNELSNPRVAARLLCPAVLIMTVFAAVVLSGIWARHVLGKASLDAADVLVLGLGCLAVSCAIAYTGWASVYGERRP